MFLWLVIGPRTATADIIAAGLLGFAGISDWLDGKLARMLNQASRLGQLLDPAADRLYIVATIIALAVRGIIPWWLFAVLAAREVCVALALLVLRRRTGYGALQVSFVGKAATLVPAVRVSRCCSSARHGRSTWPGCWLGFRDWGSRCTGGPRAVPRTR